VLDEVPGGRGDLHGVDPAGGRPGEIGAAPVADDRQRPGVRDGHGDRVQPDRQAHAELLDDHPDGRDEALPLRVGLRPGQQQERRAGRVVQQVDGQLGVGVALPVVAGEDHRGPAGAVVEQLVDVEGDDAPAAVLEQQVLAGEALGRAGVDEAVEGLDQHRARQVGQVGLDLEQLARVQLLHGVRLPGAGSCVGPTRRSGRVVPREGASPGEAEVGAVRPGEVAVALEPAQRHLDTVSLGGEVEQQGGDALELRAGRLHGGHQLVEAGLRGLGLRQPAEGGRRPTVEGGRQLDDVGADGDDLVEHGQQPGEDLPRLRLGEQRHRSTVRSLR
jgi:hypothetical protein